MGLLRVRTIHSHTIHLHLSILTLTLPLKQLLQQSSNNLRILIRLLLSFTLANRIQLPKKPHFLQLSDEHLQIFRCSDLEHHQSAHDTTHTHVEHIAHTNPAVSICI